MKETKKLLKSYRVNKDLRLVAAAVAVAYEPVQNSHPLYTGVT